MKENYSLPTAIVVFLSYFLRFSSAMVHFRSPSISFSVVDVPATFAVPVNGSGICGALYVAHPLDACSSIRSSIPRFSNTHRVRFVLIERGNCSFEDKVKHAQDAGFRAAIVFDNEDSTNLMSMISDGQGEVQIHAVFVSKRGGELLKIYAQDEDGECCITPMVEGRGWTVLVISMFSLVIIISVVAILIFIRNHQLQRQRTSCSSAVVKTEAVKSLPCITFHAACQNSNLTAETCAICLEDYHDSETLRVLRCQHEFHASCVDEWLTKWGTFCPVCKDDVRGITLGMSSSQPPSHIASRPSSYEVSEAVETVDVHAANGLISSGHRYLDVRTVEEFKKGHLESALNVPYVFMTPEGRVKNPQFLEQVSLICNKEDHLIVGCQSGVRSLHASADLLNAGFKHIKNMGGGYAAWLENGLGVKKPEAEL